MAQSEKILWDVLTLIKGKYFDPKNHQYLPEEEFSSDQHDYIANCVAAHDLKAWLVLSHLPADIDDTIYFMWFRGYLENHNLTIYLEPYAHSLSGKALKVLKRRELPEEEQNAFQEALWELSPRFWGMGPNLREWKRRLPIWGRRFRRRMDR